MSDAFDADVLIYAATPGHPLGPGVRALFDTSSTAVTGVGSVLLIPEVLCIPKQSVRVPDLETRRTLLSKLALREVDDELARLATHLRSVHGLRAVDAVHLATAVATGAERFITNNRRDFPTTIPEIDIVYPDALAAS